MEHTGRQPAWVDVLWPETQDVGRRDRPGAYAEHVADHATQPGVGAAKGFDRRWVVVRLDLERNLEVIVEVDDPGVVSMIPALSTKAERTHGALMASVAERR